MLRFHAYPKILHPRRDPTIMLRSHICAEILHPLPQEGSIKSLFPFLDAFWGSTGTFWDSMKAVRTASYLSPYNCPIEITQPRRLSRGAGWLVEMVMGIWGEWGLLRGVLGEQQG